MLTRFARSKEFKVLVGVFAVSGLIGCRSTTSKLATIPGMGWLDRDGQSFGEGWAGYEPAPELPKPSATSEPAGAKSPASGLAKRGSDSFADKYADGTPKYDATGFAKSGIDSPNRYGSPNLGSTYGRFASASDRSAGNSSKNSGIGVQDGPYGGSSTRPSANTSSFASSDTGGGSSSRADSTAGDSSYQSRFGTSLGSSTRSSLGARSSEAAAYTADRGSRFGAGSTSSTSGLGNYGATTSSNRTYTPPGFVSNERAASSGNSSTSRFGAPPRSAGLDSTLGKADGTGGLTSRPSFGSSNAPSFGSSKAPTSGGGLINSYTAKAQQQANAFASQAKAMTENGSSAANGYSTSLQNAATQAQQNVSQAVNGYAKQATDRFNTAVQDFSKSAQSRFSHAANSAIDQASTTAEDYASRFASGAQQKYDSLLSSPAATAAKGYAQQAQQQLGAAQQNLAPGNGLVDRTANSLQQTYNAAANQAVNATQAYVDRANQAARDLAGQGANYVDQAANGLRQKYDEVARSAPVAKAQQYANTAQNVASGAREAVKNFAASGDTYLDKISAGGSGAANAYPSTTTPNGYPSTGTPNAYNFVPRGTPAATTPNYSAPNTTPPAYTPPASPIQRSTTPWRPGGTSDLKGATSQTSFKQEIPTSVAKHGDEPGHLVLAVGDRYQFPAMLR